MFQFTGCPPNGLSIQPPVPGHSPRRVSPFGNPRIKARLQLPEAYRRLPRPSSAPCPKASTARPSQLGSRSTRHTEHDTRKPEGKTDVKSEFSRFATHCNRDETRLRALQAQPPEGKARQYPKNTMRLSRCDTTARKPRRMEDSGIEPLTYGVQNRRSPS